ncbi:MAG: chemotaxis protein CheX [Oribacterium sp.]|nr:chemotaxis protein CheX [Oribacterium sp.]MDY6317645.1 chemotaxis protein CheX [Oribacterium sp.]
MYAQFFGSYLLNQHAVSPEALTNAIQHMHETHIKLGTLAIHMGYMTAEQVDDVCETQKKADMRFGEIALDKEYLTLPQVKELLNAQRPEYLLLGQELIDEGVLTNSQFETLLADYQFDADISDLGTEENEESENIIRKFFADAERPVDDYTLLYLNMVFNDFVRFIGSDFTPLPAVKMPTYTSTHCISQNVTGEISLVSRLDMDDRAAIGFASRFAKMEFEKYDDYVIASIGDFLNLHNGLYSVNMSNQYAVELELDPPMEEDKKSISVDDRTYVIPVIYPFGTVHLILTI